MLPGPLNPVITARVDPESVNPLLEPVRVPPLLLKSMLVSAKAAAGIIKQAKKHRVAIEDLAATMKHSFS